MIFYAQSRNALITGAWVWWVIPPGLCICLVCLALMMISYSLEGRRRGGVGMTDSPLLEVRTCPWSTGAAADRWTA